jgi:hypothetical protein
VLTDRIARGGKLSWLWRLKDKVAIQMATYLFDMLPAELRDPKPSLSQAEKQQTLANHPLLQSNRQVVSERARLGHRMSELRACVERLVMHSRRSTGAQFDSLDRDPSGFP